MENGKFKISEISVVVVLILLSLASFGFFFFNQILTADDWRGVSYYAWFDKLYIAVGRFFQRLVSDLTLQNTFAPSFYASFLMSSLIFISYILKKIFAWDNLSWLLFGSVFVTFPFWIEWYLFKVGTFSSSLGLLLATFSAVLVVQLLVSLNKTSLDLLKFIGACFLLCLAAGAKQDIPLFSLMIVLLYVIQSKQISIFKLLKVIVGWVVFSGLLYIATIYLSSVFYDVKLLTGKQGYNIGIDVAFSEFLNNGVSVLQIICGFYTEGQLMLPFYCKMLFVISIVTYVIRQLDSIDKKKWLIFGGTIILPWSLGILLGELNTTFRYSSLISIVPFLAYMVVFVHFRKYVTIVLVMTFVFYNSSVTYSIYMSNQRDLSLVSELVSRIHLLEDFDSSKRYNLHFINKKKYRSLGRPFTLENDYDFKLKTSIYNSSAWDQTPYMLEDLIEITGNGTLFNTNKNISRKINLDELDLHIRKNELRPWPESGSIFIYNDDNIIVNFEKKVQ